jgi:hypothetical protein
MELPQSARDLIVSGQLAHLVTLNADGSPQVSCVWVGLDGDEIVSAHLAVERLVHEDAERGRGVPAHDASHEQARVQARARPHVHLAAAGVVGREEPRALLSDPEPCQQASASR